MLISYDILDAGSDPNIRPYFQELLPYPFISLLSGLAFFVMGANYWGRCYAVGIVFFASAAVMPLDMALSPLLFGIVWTVVLVMFGVHLRRQGQAQAASAAAKVPSSQAATVQYKQ